MSKNSRTFSKQKRKLQKRLNIVCLKDHCLLEQCPNEEPALVTKRLPQGLYFNSLTDGCDFRRNVDCGGKDESEDKKEKKTTTVAPDVTQDDDEEGEEKESVDDILAQIKAAGGILYK